MASCSCLPDSISGRILASAFFEKLDKLVRKQINLGGEEADNNAPAKAASENGKGAPKEKESADEKN